MKRLISALAVATLAMASAPAAAQEARIAEGEAKLAEMIEGRVAGEPQSCVNAMRSNDIEVIEYVGIVYDAGDTIWVARAKDPRSLGWTDVPIIDRFGSQLCKFDVIRTVDRSTGMTTGAVFLEDFVPYAEQG